MKAVLTKEHIATLAKYEKYFNQAVGARWCSHPGMAAIDEMLSIWNEVTKEGRRINHGCSTCLLHLVFDLGTLYFAQKGAQDEPKVPEGKTTQPKGEKAAKAAKGGQKRKK